MSRNQSIAGSGGLAADFVTLNEYLRTSGDRDTALQRLVATAVTSVPGCDWAAVTEWAVNKRPRSLATSSDTAREVDQLQYDLGDGPCLSAVADSELVRVDDITTEHRWPEFCARAVSDTPVRGVLSFHLVDQPQRCALNLYAGRTGAFSDEAVTIAAIFAAHARVLLIHAASSAKASTLEHALTTSRQIGAAIGILMNVHRVTADQAFDLLRRVSQHLNRKLYDIADEVVETGTLPEPRRPGTPDTAPGHPR